MKISRFENQKQLISDASDLTGHFLDNIAFTSEKTIASIVLLLSTLPEFFGLMAATGNAWVSVSSSAISLVLVKLALRETPHAASFPFLSVDVRFYPFWIMYLAQLSAGVVWIIYSGHYIDIALIVFSFCGAVSSEKIAQVIRHEIEEKQAAELRYNTQYRVEEVKAELKIEELTERSKARIEKIRPHGQKSIPIADDPLITEDKAQQGAKKGRATQSARVAQRRESIRLYLQDYPQATNKELADKFGVSMGTIKKDKRENRPIISR